MIKLVKATTLSDLYSDLRASATMACKFIYTIINNKGEKRTSSGRTNLEVLSHHFGLTKMLLPKNINEAVDAVYELPQRVSFTCLLPKATKQLVKGEVYVVNLCSEINGGMQVWPMTKYARKPRAAHSMWVGMKGSLKDYDIIIFENKPFAVVMVLYLDEDNDQCVKLLHSNLRPINVNKVPMVWQGCTFKELWDTLYIVLGLDYFHIVELTVLGPFLDPEINEPITITISNKAKIFHFTLVEDVLILPPTSAMMKEQWEDKLNDCKEKYLEMIKASSKIKNDGKVTAKADSKTKRVTAKAKVAAKGKARAR